MADNDLESLKSGDYFVARNDDDQFLVGQLFRRAADGVLESHIVNGAWTAHFDSDGAHISSALRVDGSGALRSDGFRIVWTRQLTRAELAAEAPDLADPSIPLPAALAAYVKRVLAAPALAPSS